MSLEPGQVAVQQFSDGALETTLMLKMGAKYDNVRVNAWEQLRLPGLRHPSCSTTTAFELLTKSAVHHHSYIT